MISVHAIHNTTYEITVAGKTTTTHRVTVNPAYYEQLTGGRVSPATLASRSGRPSQSHIAHRCKRHVLLVTWTGHSSGRGRFATQMAASTSHPARLGSFSKAVGLMMS